MRGSAGAAVVVIIVAAMPIESAEGDDEASQVAYVVAGRYGRCYFKMVPDPKARYDPRRGQGYAYEVSDKGPDKLLWQTAGWYAHRTAISVWGRYLVRLGNWPRGHKPSNDHLGIAFYDRGKLIKRYSTKELIKDLSKVEPSVSHYEFLKKVVGFLPNSDRLFRIVAVDGKRWTFDVTNGKIVSIK